MSTIPGRGALLGRWPGWPGLGRAHFASAFPPESRTAMAPPRLEIVRVSLVGWEDGPDLDGGGALAVGAPFFDVVVVVGGDDVEVELPALPAALASDVGLPLVSPVGATVVVVVDDSGACAVLVVDGC